MRPSPGRVRPARSGGRWSAAVCLVLLALLGAGVRTDFGPQLRLDVDVSEALYVG